jgi:membrane glycosyltransferase
MVSIPISVWSSRASLGRAFRERGLFLIPEESNPPRELRRTYALTKRAPEPSGFVEAAVSPVSNALACAFGTVRDRLGPAAIDRRLGLIQTALLQGPKALSTQQKNSLLGDPIALSRLHLRLWTARDAHPDWHIDREADLTARPSP